MSQINNLSIYVYSQEVVNDYEELFETGDEYDVIIYAGENESIKEIRAHSLVLFARSQYFRAGFSMKWAEKSNGKFIFKKPNISSQIFKIILRFIYCGKIDLTNLQGSDLLKLLMAVDELVIQTLISCIQDCLIKQQHEFLRENFIEILETVYQNESFTELYNFYLDEICENPKLLFNSDKFINLPAPLLEVILKRDDLSLVEIEVWESLIKWGLAQGKTLNKDFSEWHQNEFNDFKRILHKFIPLIRFYEISSDDYFNKVRPYEEILSMELRNDIYKFHMVSGCKPTLNKHLPRCPKSLNQKQVLYIEMKLKSTFQQSKVQNDDIICFQDALTGKEIDKQITARKIPQFYDFRVEHLYLTVMIVTDEIFKKYQGFNLFNFEDYQYPFSKVHSYKILKNKSYSTFKENVSLCLKISNKQVRFWVFVNRTNKTIRPDATITESFANMNMEDIHTKMAFRQSELKLYMEVADKPFNDKSWFPPVDENHVIVFLKYFDPDKQTLVGLGHLYVQLSEKVSYYTHVLCGKKNFPPDTPLQIYEEIKPNMIEKMKLKSTLQQSVIQNGDIICFQKALTEKEIQEHITAGRVYNIPQFYNVMNTKIGKL